MEENYYIYMLRCEDNSLYTGIARDYIDRYKKHLDGTGAKYTKARKPVKIERVWSVEGRGPASKVEYFLKQYSKKNKEQFIESVFMFKDLVYDKKGINIISEKIL